MINKYYTYVLRSLKDNCFYVGSSKDLDSRLKKHSKGYVLSTKKRRPFELIYYEVCFSLDDAIHREKYLKTTYGRRYIKNRIKNTKNGFSL
jgi:putative endonuclease